jgi:hypothetical protein
MLVNGQTRSDGTIPVPRSARERAPKDVEDRRDSTGVVETTERENAEDEDKDKSTWEARRG